MANPCRRCSGSYETPAVTRRLAGFVLEAGSTELPDCRCGAEMSLVRTALSHKSPNTEIRFYECSTCGHELRLMAWREPTIEVGLLSGC